MGSEGLLRQPHLNQLATGGSWCPKQKHVLSKQVFLKHPAQMTQRFGSEISTSDEQRVDEATRHKIGPRWNFQRGNDSSDFHRPSVRGKERRRSSEVRAQPEEASLGLDHSEHDKNWQKFSSLDPRVRQQSNQLAKSAQRGIFSRHFFLALRKVMGGVIL